MTKTIAIYSNPPEVVVGQEPVYTVTVENGFNPVELIVSRTVIAVSGAGAPGKDGQPGIDGAGVPAGGTTGQVLAKLSEADNDTGWVDANEGGGVSDHTLLSNIGSNSHAQIDTALTRLAQTSGINTGDQDLTALQSHVAVVAGNPHGVTKSHVGLSNADNTSDAEKPLSDAQAFAIGAKQDVLVSGVNIKTINGTAVLGAGNIVVGGPAYDMLSILAGAEISITEAATATIGRMHVCSGTSADYTVTLPAVSGNAGKMIGFRMSSALTKLVTLDGDASEAIDGSLTRIMWAGEVAILMCDGAAWAKIGGKSRPMIAGIAISSNHLFGSGTPTKINIDTALVAASLPGMQDTTNKRLIAMRAGIYSIVGKLRWGNTNNNVNPYNTNTYVYKNGSQLSAESGYFPVNSAPFTGVITTAVLSVNDYLELWGYFDVGTFTTTSVIVSAVGTNLQITEMVAW